MEGYMLNETIAIYAIIDDLLKAIGHIHLLQQLYKRIFMPTAVYQDLTVDPPVPGTVERIVRRTPPPR